MKRLHTDNINTIFDLLKKQGYIVVGPTLGDGAIIYNEIDSVKDLPIGWTDEHNAGYYRLKKREDDSLFGYVVGPQSWKKYLFPPKLMLWGAERNGKSFIVKQDNRAKPKYAFIGVRSCELNAIFIQDKVFNNGIFSDSYYNEIRKNAFIIAVNCTQAGGTCFCVSMKTGPKVKSGYDLAITEVINKAEHYFLAEDGSKRGTDFLSLMNLPDASEEEKYNGGEAIVKAENSMGRKMESEGIKELLYNNLENPIWKSVASRCLTCANCTMVCPTCFCSTMEDVTDLRGDNAERWRKWDSCFNLDYSKVAGGNFRTSADARYRQWITHKLASWIDQFGTSGCVGCGRCISWCPVGIDITEEISKLRTSQKTK